MQCDSRPQRSRHGQPARHQLHYRRGGRKSKRLLLVYYIIAAMLPSLAFSMQACRHICLPLWVQCLRLLQVIILLPCLSAMNFFPAERPAPGSHSPGSADKSAASSTSISFGSSSLSSSTTSSTRKVRFALDESIISVQDWGPYGHALAGAGGSAGQDLSFGQSPFRSRGGEEVQLAPDDSAASTASVAMSGGRRSVGRTPYYVGRSTEFMASPPPLSESMTTQVASPSVRSAPATPAAKEASGSGNQMADTPYVSAFLSRKREEENKLQGSGGAHVHGSPAARLSEASSPQFEALSPIAAAAGDASGTLEATPTSSTPLARALKRQKSDTEGTE
jgi:hypothetical protein